MQRFTLAVLAASFGLAASAQAQRPQPVVRPSSRWVINGHSSMALGTTVTDAFNEVKTSSGLGAGVEVGYRVTPQLLTYVGLEINKQPVDAFETGGRLRPHPPGSRRQAQLPDQGQQDDALRRRLGRPAEPQHHGGRLRHRNQLGPFAVGPCGWSERRGTAVRVTEARARWRAQHRGWRRSGNIKFDGEKQNTQSLENTTTMRLRFGAKLVSVGVGSWESRELGSRDS